MTAGDGWVPRRLRHLRAAAVPGSRLAPHAACAAPVAADQHPRPPFPVSPTHTEGLIQFLVHEKTFNEDRVRKAIDRINIAKGKASQV